MVTWHIYKYFGRKLIFLQDYVKHYPLIFYFIFFLAEISKDCWPIGIRGTSDFWGHPKFWTFEFCQEHLYLFRSFEWNINSIIRKFVSNKMLNSSFVNFVAVTLYVIFIFIKIDRNTMPFPHPLRIALFRNREQRKMNWRLTYADCIQSEIKQVLNYNSLRIAKVRKTDNTNLFRVPKYVSHVHL